MQRDRQSVTFQDETSMSDKGSAFNGLVLLHLAGDLRRHFSRKQSRHADESQRQDGLLAMADFERRSGSFYGAIVPIAKRWWAVSTQSSKDETVTGPMEQPMFAMEAFKGGCPELKSDFRDISAVVDRNRPSQTHINTVK